MRITQNSVKSNYFYFSLDPEDFEKNYENCRFFLNRLSKEFTSGKGGERYWLKELKCWAIRKDCRQKFQQLLQEYFDIEKQEEAF